MVKLETSLWYSSIFLKGLSLSPQSPKASRIQKAANLAHFLFVILSAWSLFFQILIHIVKNSTSSYFITEHVSTQVAFLQLISKVTMYRVNRKKFFRLLSNMNNMMKNGSVELKRHLQGFGSIGNVIYLSYTCAVLIVVMDFCLAPIFRAERDLPIAAWYPFSYRNSTLLYSIVYSHQISVLVMCWLCTGAEVMFGVLVFGCCARYKLMQEKLRALNKSDDDQPHKRSGAKVGRNFGNEFHEKVAKLVDLHSEIIESIEDMNDINTYILFALFMTSVVMICCAGFQITNGYEKSINSHFIFSAMVCCVLLELLFYFLPGDMLVQEASAVRMAAYDSNWESMPPKYRYCILSIILQSGKPPRLETGRVTPLTLTNYASFLATSASYFTSLRAIAGVD